MTKNLIKLALKFRVRKPQTSDNWKRKVDETTHDTIQKPIYVRDLISRLACCK